MQSEIVRIQSGGCSSQNAIVYIVGLATLTMRKSGNADPSLALVLGYDSAKGRAGDVL